LNIKNLLET